MKVFISHFSGDTWVARQIGKEIKRRGFETFLDAVDLETGDVLEETIRENLDGSDELLVLLTPEALERPYIWMEVGAAWVQKKRIVGILYRLTAADVATRERTPALLKSTLLRDLNEIEEYFDELSREQRDEHSSPNLHFAHAGGSTFRRGAVASVVGEGVRRVRTIRLGNR